MQLLYKKLQLQFRNAVHTTTASGSASRGQPRVQLGVICIMLLLVAVTLAFAYTFASMVFDSSDSSMSSDATRGYQIVADSDFSLRVVDLELERQKILRRLEGGKASRTPAVGKATATTQGTEGRLLPLPGEQIAAPRIGAAALDIDEEEEQQQQQQQQQQLGAADATPTARRGDADTIKMKRAPAAGMTVVSEQQRAETLSRMAEQTKEEWWMWLESQSLLWHQVDATNWARRERVQDVRRVSRIDAALRSE